MVEVFAAHHSVPMHLSSSSSSTRGRKHFLLQWARPCGGPPVDACDDERVETSSSSFHAFQRRRSGGKADEETEAQEEEEEEEEESRRKGDPTVAAPHRFPLLSCPSSSSPPPGASSFPFRPPTAPPLFWRGASLHPSCDDTSARWNETRGSGGGGGNVVDASSSCAIPTHTTEEGRKQDASGTGAAVLIAMLTPCLPTTADLPPPLSSSAAPPPTTTTSSSSTITVIPLEPSASSFSPSSETTAREQHFELQEKNRFYYTFSHRTSPSSFSSHYTSSEWEEDSFLQQSVIDAIIQVCVEGELEEEARTAWSRRVAPLRSITRKLHHHHHHHQENPMRRSLRRRPSGDGGIQANTMREKRPASPTGPFASSTTPHETAPPPLSFFHSSSSLSPPPSPSSSSFCFPVSLPAGYTFLYRGKNLSGVECQAQLFTDVLQYCLPSPATPTDGSLHSVLAADHHSSSSLVGHSFEMEKIEEEEVSSRTYHTNGATQNVFGLSSMDSHPTGFSPVRGGPSLFSSLDVPCPMFRICLFRNY